MRIIVTGAAGFVGSHLVDRYLADGHIVVGIDNLLTGDPRNLEAARPSSDFSFLVADVAAEGFDLGAAALRADLIVHCASPASPVDYAKAPLETMAANSLGTWHCAQAASAWSARLLYASTSEVYGDPLEHPQPESYWGNVNPIGPRACYDESKRFGEALVTSYVRSLELDARIVRIFNTYGPRMRADDGRVIPNFIGQALAGNALTIYGDGSQTRSFCYVSDLVDGIVRCAASDKTRGVVVNLGNPQELTIGQLAAKISEMLGVPLAIERSPMPADDPGRRRPDISRARELLGWEPRVSLDEGLRATIEDFRTRATRAGSRA
ncbi:MAG: SDR family oxidoreductase [Candidatus Eremiobacteraeota bacterium]|nr:SDR family oxidoreductase [Candidatus Eremiobacteraeota bacterium]MBV8282918.1 SDR family oxidoreductase [Candidatus Eremiobacteraeota bacterium]